VKRIQTALWPLCLLLIALPAHADGTLVVGDRVLLRQGPSARGYCSAAGSGAEVECDRVLTKVLSGYTYGKGYLVGGLTGESPRTLAAAGVLHVETIGGALPGGDFALAAIDGVLGGSQLQRLRFTLLDAQSMFMCRDAQSGQLVPPVIGMLSRACLPTSMTAFDLGLLAMQWDVASDRLMAEWLHVGPAIELLQDGFGYAHLLRSIGIGLPFDVRSVQRLGASRVGGTSLGFGARLSAFYRSPHWEARIQLRHRLALFGGAGALHDNLLDGELRLLHNFFLSDAIALQAGVSIRGSWSQRPEEAFLLWSAATRRWSAFAGLYLGWVHESPGI
jgi:hypothetical protein